MNELAGKTVAHYTILEQVGQGGMGVVYKARDTKLDRIVALKFLPPQLASSEHDRARFSQEARAASAINHPNICTIYAIDEFEGSTFIAMEYVEGETLRQKMLSGTIHAKNAIDIGIQLAEGLGAAHEKGITHRDIKPENIIVRGDGIAQIMDFGLAKLRSNSSKTHRLTQEGSTVGTAGYMSPEQVQGQDVDHRSDIFSLGVVLYELVAGQLPFRGVHETALLYEIVNVDPPPPSIVRSGLDPALDAIVLGCLEKEKNERSQSAKQVAIDLKKIRRESGRQRLSGVTSSRPELRESRSKNIEPKSSRMRFLWPASTILLAGLLLVVLFQRQGGQAPPVEKFAIMLPSGMMITLVNHPALAISPDGSRFVYRANGMLYLRRIDSFAAEPITGSEEGDTPFFSPDGRWLAFFSTGKLKKAPVTGGSSVTLSDAQNNRGGTWLSDGSIVFTPAGRGGMSRVNADGSDLRVLTNEDTTKSERTHRWPQALPDGKHVLFTIGYMGSPDYYEDATIAALNVSDGSIKQILKGASTAKYISSGYLVYTHGGSLFAVPFDPDRLEVKGTAFPVIDDVSCDVTTGASHFAVSDNGTIVYVPGSSTISKRHLVYIDLAGKVSTLVAPPQSYIEPRISPDGKRIACAIQSDKDFDIWCYDIQRNTMSRLTFGGANRSPIWSSDSKRIAYSNNSSRVNGGSVKARIEIVAADGSGTLESIEIDADRTYANCWSSDGSKIVVTVPRVRMGWDLMVIDLKAGKKVTTFLSTKFDESYAALSPDGKWIAYSSNETGVVQIYVKPFPAGDSKWQVSPPSNSSPIWSADGKRLLFGTSQGIMQVTIAGTQAITAGEPQMVLKGYIGAQVESSVTFDITPDGQKLLVTRPKDGDESLQRMNIVLNWFTEVTNKVSASK